MSVRMVSTGLDWLQLSKKRLKIPPPFRPTEEETSSRVPFALREQHAFYS